MRRILVLLGLASVAVLAANTLTEAQVRPFLIGISGGPSTPIGDFADEVSAGYHVQGSFDVSLPLLPLGLRADALWQEFGLMGAGGNVRQLGLLGNVLLHLPLPPLRPYVLAGAAFTNSTFPDLAHGDHAHAGENEAAVTGQVGAGVRGGLIGLMGVIEVRMLGLGDHRSVPVSIGIMF